MLSRRQLRKALRKIPLVRFEGALCRTLYVETLYEFSKGTAHSPRPLFNLGAPKKGARYTPKGAGECYVIFTDALVAPAFVRIRDAHSRLVGTLP